jgi:hypothetical protein
LRYVSTPTAVVASSTNATIATVNRVDNLMIALWAALSSTPAPSCPVVYLESTDRGNLSGTAAHVRID